MGANFVTTRVHRWTTVSGKLGSDSMVLTAATLLPVAEGVWCE